jgi:hypothetical protein
VVVGVDDSLTGLAALRAVAAEARLAIAVFAREFYRDPRRGD